MNTPITPETRVADLLDAYPALEESLIASVPALEKLRNPVLRKTVTKVTTLEQAARLGGLSACELVQRLRGAAGQPDEDEPGGMHPGAPGWLCADSIRHNIDATSMLERGVHPIGTVRECVATLAPGEIIRLTSGFRPAPLIDLMSRSGLAVYSTETSPGSHETFFARPMPE